MRSMISDFPGFMSPQKLNPVEPPWYGPVCLVVWEGRRREASPYPVPSPTEAFLRLRLAEGDKKSPRFMTIKNYLHTYLARNGHFYKTNPILTVNRIG